MNDPVERPRLGLVPVLLVGTLALLGAVTVVTWITSVLFGLLRLVLVVAVVVLALVWLTSRGRGAQGS